MHKRDYIMAKKKNHRKTKKRATRAKHEARQLKKKPKITTFSLIAFLVGGILVLGGVYFRYHEEKSTTQTSKTSILKTTHIGLQEDRPTLSPLRFSGTFRMAYEVARAIPEVLDQLYCYCRCQENMGHKNLLSCYVDTHAST
ncbi:hypothetical protein D1AOALGA4SA_2369 [Olavius algarvensis Delta 1 endosymbiont]|nr:hypothetical protein D1AOALGA4SA_2369 [Olavius algarvensis Delta 1 endosymbiont]